MSTYEDYQVINNSIQLLSAELVSMKCLNRGLFKEQKSSITIKMQRKVEMVNEREATIFLRTIVGGKEAPFLFDLVYKGECECFAEITPQRFEQYAYTQVVPLLLPYARECVSSTMARMGLPIFTIPTIDVLDSYEANDATRIKEF